MQERPDAPAYLGLIASLLVVSGLDFFATSPASSQLQDTTAGIPIGSAVGVLAVNKSESEQVACTQEAKLCPDGSYVGRTGSKCEFAECPTTNSESGTRDANWTIYRNEQYGFELKYPAELKVSSPIVHENLNKQGKVFELHIGSVILLDEVIITDYLSSDVGD